MLKIQSNLPKLPEKSVEVADTTALYKHLKEVESRPNIITLDVFREFEPLFQINNNLSGDDIAMLTSKFVRLIDFYKETHVIQSSVNPRVLVTLPSIFTPIRSLEINAQNASLVASNAANFHSSVPKYSHDAFANMFTAIRKEQYKNIPRIKEYEEQYVICVQEFFKKYNKKPVSKAPTTEDILGATVSSSETEWNDE